jgi:hypothetical protein
MIPGVPVLSTGGPIGHPALGIVIPALIFAVSFVATWLLHRHFSKQ